MGIVFAGVVVTLTVGCLVVGARVSHSARREIEEADKALARGETLTAIDGYVRAARMRVPWHGTFIRALDRLEEIGFRAEREGERRVARVALEGARGAILGSRTLGVHDLERLARIDERLARLLAEEDASGGSLEERVAWHRARLSHVEGPRPFSTVMALLGFLLFLTGGAGLTLRGIARDGRVSVQGLALWAAWILTGLVLCLWGLARA